MIRLAIVFLVAVFLPSVVLGVLALRTAGEQQAILERQAAEIWQNETDALAAGVGDAILGRQREFARRVRDLLAEQDARMLGWEFGEKLGGKGIPFVIDPDGVVVSGAARGVDAEAFISDNRTFLSNAAEAEVFPTRQNAFSGAAKEKLAAMESRQRNEPETVERAQAVDAKMRGAAESLVKAPRKVAPAAGLQAPSRAVPQVSDFQSAIGNGSDGVLARFSRNRLELIFWTRPPEADGHVFALALPAEEVADFARRVFEALAPPEASEVCLALLDENARPVAQTVPGFQAQWKRPFVATEIGELLPHWEAALYLREPGALAESARLVTLTLVLLIGVAIAAILAGGTFVAWDARRQMALAQRKTDFVSNVSHELKTPLTSIRMFAEMLERGTTDPKKRADYLRIILHESERLTRLINNVLDFARMEKHRHSYRKRSVDLFPILAEVWEAHSPHLREAGFVCEWKADPGPYPAEADSDAVSQVLVNLLSNAEKYSAETKEIAVTITRETRQLRIEVMDRGIGIRPGENEKIFEPFHRSDDSLSSGAQGSGLGLALARRIASDHGGKVIHRPRSGGGSIFTFTLPLDS